MKPKPNTQHAKPETPRQLALYKTRLVCGIGKAILNGKTKLPPGVPRVEYALYTLLEAVEELAGLVDEATNGGAE